MESQIIGIIGVFIPIIAIIVSGLVIVTHIYFTSKEKQMLIDKGSTPEELKLYFQKKSDSNLFLRAGIVFVFIGLGIAAGRMVEDMTTKEFYVPVFIISFFGIGLILSHFITNRQQNQKKERLENTK